MSEDRNLLTLSMESARAHEQAAIRDSIKKYLYSTDVLQLQKYGYQR